MFGVTPAMIMQRDAIHSHVTCLVIVVVVVQMPFKVNKFSFSKFHRQSSGPILQGPFIIFVPDDKILILTYLYSAI